MNSILWLNVDYQRKVLPDIFNKPLIKKKRDRVEILRRNDSQVSDDLGILDSIFENKN